MDRQTIVPIKPIEVPPRAPQKETPSTPLEKLLDAVKKNIPISLPSTGRAMDDVFIVAWALREAIRYIAQRHQIYNDPYITYYSDDPAHPQSFQFEREFAQMPANDSPGLSKNGQPENATESYIHYFATKMGAHIEDIPSKVLHAIPRPFAFDHPRFNSWDKDFETQQETYTKRVDESEIQKKAIELKEKLGGKKLIVINMAGSLSEKRFSLEQVQTLCRLLRKKYTAEDVHIAVLSDAKTASPKIFGEEPLGEEGSTFRQERRTYDPVVDALASAHLREDVPTKVLLENNKLTISTPGYRLGEIKTQDLELEADEFTVVEDLNTLAAYSQVADVAITTDTFWSWWMAQANKLIVLYTIANKYWKVPDCEPVWSEVIKNTTLPLGATMLTPEKYRDYYQKIEHTIQRFGPSKTDFEMMCEYLETLPESAEDL